MVLSTVETLKGIEGIKGRKEWEYVITNKNANTASAELFPGINLLFIDPSQPFHYFFP